MPKHVCLPAPSLHGHYPLPRYYAPARLPTGALAAVMCSPRALVPRHDRSCKISQAFLAHQCLRDMPRLLVDTVPPAVPPAFDTSTKVG
jgi:hypothetical protein